MSEAVLNVGVGDPGQVLADRADRAERGQALFGVVAVKPDVLLDQRLQELPAARREGAALEEDLAQPARPVGDPGVEGAQQGVAVDEVVLERQQAEQEVAAVFIPSPTSTAAGLFPTTGRVPAEGSVHRGGAARGTGQRYSPGIG